MNWVSTRLIRPAGDLGRDEVLLELLDAQAQVVGDADDVGRPLVVLVVEDRAREVEEPALGRRGLGCCRPASALGWICTSGAWRHT
jgi:hypothetical protein